MIRVELFLGLVSLVLFIFCLIDLIQTPEDEVRHLRKMHWILLIIFLPMVGSIAWLVAGRPQRSGQSSGPYPRSSAQFPEYNRPGRATASNPDDDEAFLRRVRERAEEQRRKAAEKEAAENEGEEKSPDEGSGA